MNVLSLLVAVLVGGMGVHYWVSRLFSDQVALIVAIVVMVLLFVFGVNPVLR